MRRRAAGMVLLAMVGCVADALSLEMALRSSTGVHVARDARFDGGAQFHGSIGAFLEIVTRPGLGVGFAAEYEAATASPVVDLVTYRGYGGTRLGGYAVLWIPVEQWGIGLRVGGVGSFLRYAFTIVFFVTTGLWIEPAVSLIPTRAPRNCPKPIVEW